MFVTFTIINTENKMRKYILLLLLAVCAHVSADVLDKVKLFKATAQLNGKPIPMWFNITGDDVVEVGNGKNAAISQYAEGKLIVPSTIVNPADNRTYKVKRVANFAFNLCSKLSEVSLEEGLNEIGEHAFVGCNALQTVSMPATITVIGRGAFMGCKQLLHADLPQQLTAIEQECFVENRFSNNKLLLPAGIKSIPLAAFQHCQLQQVVLSPNVSNIDAEAFMQTVACHFYMFDGNTAPTINPKGVSTASHWYATNPQLYATKSLCGGLLTVSAMVPNETFSVGDITYKIVQTPQYPGVFTASAYKTNGDKVWGSTFNSMPEWVLNPVFPGNWQPQHRINGIEPTFFAGSQMAKLQHITLPSSIEGSRSAKAFAHCKALVAVNLLAMQPMTRTESDALLEGLAENAVVYAPKGQTEEHRAYNYVLTNNDGQRHTSAYKLNLERDFDSLAYQANMAYLLPYSFVAERATFYRSSFANKQKETLVLPFAAKPQGSAFAFIDMTDQPGPNANVAFKRKDDMLANTPYIYVSDGTPIVAQNVEVNAVEMPAEIVEKDNLFGTYHAGLLRDVAANRLLNGTTYLLKQSELPGSLMFTQSSADVFIAPFQAYFHVSNPLYGANLKLVLEGDNTTGIKQLSTEGNIDANAWFNLQGVRLKAKPQKGVFIHQGKKVLMK